VSDFKRMHDEVFDTNTPYTENDLNDMIKYVNKASEG